MNFGEIYQRVQHLVQMNRFEAQKLFECAEKVKEGGVIVEIGTYKGGSAAILASAFPGMIYSIDIDPQMESNDLFVRGEFFLKNVTFITGKSEDIAFTWDKEIDMLFIDGSHDYIEVHKDIEMWVPKVKEGGTILFHDYGSHTEVTIAVNEALMKRIGFANNSLLAIIK